MSEHDEQVALFQWLELFSNRYPEAGTAFAIPNGGHRHVRVGMKLKAEGVKAGVPDICVPVGRGGFFGLYIELKHGDNTTRDSQKEYLEVLNAQGYLAEVAYEMVGAKELIERYFRMPPTIGLTTQTIVDDHLDF